MYDMIFICVATSAVVADGDKHIEINVVKLASSGIIKYGSRCPSLTRHVTRHNDNKNAKKRYIRKQIQRELNKHARNSPSATIITRK